MYKCKYLIFIFYFILTSCDNTAIIPKPKAYLKLEYPTKSYHKLRVGRPYRFDVPNNTIEVPLKDNWLKIKYPLQRASVAITYRPIKNNLKKLLIESDRLVFEHTIKANQISSKNYENLNKKVYGKIFEIYGNTASQVQFHVTDSVNHFLKASLFFNTKPNYDSILPAIDYIKQDMMRMMESIEWAEVKK